MSSDKPAGPSKELDSQSDKEILAKAKTPPKPKPSHDLTSIVKKYTAQQSEILKKDFKAGQDAMGCSIGNSNVPLDATGKTAGPSGAILYWASVSDRDYVS